MADLNRPDYGQAWAEQGEKIAPDSAKMGLGWVQEMMPFQYENYLQARQDEALLYLLQKGIPEYSPTQEYIAGKSIVQYQGVLYLSKATVIGVLPTVTASWSKLTVALAANGSVPVSQGGTGATSAADARTNLGIGTAGTKDLPAITGVLVKDSSDNLIARLVTGAAGNIVVTNPDGSEGDLIIDVGSNVAKLNTDSSWTSKGGIGVPKGSSSERVEQIARLRFNTELGYFEGFDGTRWQYFGSTGAPLAVQEIPSDGVSTTYPILAIPTHRNNILVTINGIPQIKSSYTLNSTSIVFSEAPTSGVIEVIPMTSAPLGATVTWTPPVIEDATQETVLDTLNEVLSVLRTAGFIQ